ncbi:uroporphyrinogen III methyltransferase/synthase [Salana multivorans]|uniref:Uroporphyrinogen-III synthase n=1 Tax=Salana multivorans TaxID=120377 RepID=A0A3N2DAH2_9MICO|nr:uroporphyrinogen-III synthase [Salana multivorans]ROR96795.1 uroporphyrinogen III methyltransferase/synthase [Salana multivorans]
MTSLVGRTVLLAQNRPERWVAEVEARGGVALVAPVQTVEPAIDPAGLPRALGGLEPGDWLVLTSPSAVSALAAAGAVPAGIRVAVVGPGTRDAAREIGLEPELTPDDASAAGLLAAWPETASGTRALLPLSSLAPDTLARGLADRGLAPVRVEAYRVEPSPLPGPARAALAERAVDAVVLSSASSARRLVSVAPWLPRVVACIGESTAAAARAAGLDVTLVASRPVPGVVVAELADVLRTDRPAESP